MWSETVTKMVLENCLRVMVMRVPHSRTISLGLFVDHGVKDEDVRSNGISHFIEHLVFNPAHMERQTRESLEGLMDRGATYEAFTGKEFTRCTLTCRRDDLRTAVGCLASILMRARVLPEAVEHERTIILQERDTYVSSGRIKEELIEQALWGDRSLGLFVIGRRENIAEFSPVQLEPRLQEYYAPHNTQLVVLGDVAPADVAGYVEEYLADWPGRALRQRPVLVEDEPNIIALPSNQARADLTFAFLGPAFNHPDRYAMQLLGDLLGSGIKSRLFQEVRERRQLCYAIYAYSISYRMGGYLAINVNTGHEQVPAVFQAMLDVLEELKQDPVPDEELERVKAARITSLLEMTNDTRRHLQALGRHAINGRDLFVDWESSEFQRMTPEDLLRVSRTLFTQERLAISGLGVDGEELMRLL